MLLITGKDNIAVWINGKAVLEASSELHEAASEAAEDSVSDKNLASVSRDKWSEILEKMSPEDFKYKM